METAQIGATPKGGITRPTLTDLDRQARDWFKKQCGARGEILVEENVPDRPFDAKHSALPRLDLPIGRIGARRGDEIEHAPPFALHYVVVIFRGAGPAAATSCSVGLRAFLA
jgi:hypothetical protein